MSTHDNYVHKIRGGSTSDRGAACVGSYNEIAKYPEEPSGAPAIDGTHSHSLLETCLNNQVWDAEAYLGKTLTDHEGDFVVDKERVERVTVALTYIKQRLAELPGAKMLVEHVVDAGSQYGISEWGGPADVILYTPEVYENIDYKDGYKGINPDTFQAITYALGGLASVRVQPHTVRSTIIQPKRSSQPLIKDYTWDEFAEKARLLIDAMQRSMAPDAPRTPGDHCTFCRAAKPGRCPEYNEKVLNAAQQAFAAVPSTAGLTLPAITGEVSNDQLKQILDAAPLVRGWLKEAEDEALRRLSAGQSIPSYMAVRGTAHRKWRISGEELITSLKKLGLSQSDILEKKVRTPKQIESCSKAKTLPDSKRAQLQELIERPEGALKVVPTSEGQEPLREIQQAFANVPSFPSYS